MTDAATLLGLSGSWGEPGADLVAALRAALLADEPGTAPVAPIGDLVPALIAAVPQALSRHVRLGLPADVSRATLSDIGRKVSAYGAATDGPWLLALLRADVVALGRLQFARVSDGGAHAVHVPKSGPLAPASVDHSLDRAARELGATAFTCESWLLDPLLPVGLPRESNIVRFAARFAVPGVVRAEGPEAVPADHAVARFVFRRPLEEVLAPALVIPATRLERLVAAHLRAGGHWMEPVGALER